MYYWGPLCILWGGSATIVHAATNVSGTETSKAESAPADVDRSSGQQKTPTNDNHKIDENELDSIARNNDNNDTAVNDAIDKYAQVKQEEVGDNALIRASGKEPTTPANTADERGKQVDSIAKKLDQDVNEANQKAEEIKSYTNAHPNTVSGRGAEYFADQGLSVDDEKGSDISQITVDHNNKDNTLDIGQSEKIDGIYITHTDHMTHKEQNAMKINSSNKVIVDFQHDQCDGKVITVTYDNLKNSYYLENIDNKTNDNKTNKIKISKIERTFSDITPGNTIFTSDGHTPKGPDGAYDECYGPQLIIYNDPSDGFFYNNITQISVKDIYYDDKGNQIDFNTKNDKNKAWIFVTSLNSNGWGNIEKVKALGSDSSPVNGEKIAGSTVTDHNNGWWYSDNNNNFNNNPDWDNRDEDNRFGFVGTVAFQYHPGMTLQYSVEDWQWGSHWACTQTQVVSSLNTPVIIYDHIKDGIVTVDTKHPQTPNTPIDPDDQQSPKYPKDINDTEHVVNRTIDYKYSNGKQAQDTVDDHLTFERTVVIDKVTGDVLSDTWTPSQNFNDVKTPVIQGYTPDKTVVSDTNIGHDHQDIIEHVVYNADKQAAHVIYVDKTTNTTLASDDLSGQSDKDSGYNTKDTIGKYESQHYVLTGDETNGKNVVFDHDDQADQTYHVYFVHGTHTINQTTSPKQTIHYVYADGLARQGQAADDNVQQLSFKRDGYNDEVTGIDHWNAWTPANSNYNAVDSPVIQGYTPDKLSVDGSIVKPTDKDTEITVTYNADKQVAKITYIDDTTGETLKQDKLDGTSDQDAKYTTSDNIKKYEDQHYKLVSDSTNGQDLIFDHNDKADQTYEVHFVHGTQNVSRQDDVTETVDYKFENGETAQPTVTQTKHFSEDGVKDLVTDGITWTPAKPQKFDDVTTPAISGYTPDNDKVAGSTVKFGDKDIEVTVTYNNNTQNAVITYVDDTEKKTLGSDKQDGKFDHEIIFEHDPAEVIKGLEEKGYKLVSDNFKPGIKYQNDNKLNIFEVHLVHTYEPVETSQTITETVHYIDANGKSVAPDHVAKAVIDVTGTRDKVTDSITWNTPSIGHFDEVISPEVPNMTPDKKLIPGRDVQYGDNDITENVVYTSDNPTSKTPKKPHKKPHKPNNPISKTPKKSHKLGNPTSKTPKKPHKSGNPTSKTPENKQSGTIVKTAIPEKPIDSRTVDNHASAKSAGKRELPQTGATTNIGIWTGLVSMIASLGLLGASKKRKKN